MTAWLTPEWVEASARAVGTWPLPPGTDPADPPDPVLLTVVVTGTVDGEIRYERRWWPGPAPERALTLTAAADDAAAILDGGLAPSVAFMRGRLKTGGDPGAVLDVLAATAAPDFAALRARVGAVTDRPQ